MKIGKVQDIPRNRLGDRLWSMFRESLREKLSDRLRYGLGDRLWGRLGDKLWRI
jgi:hypothetical protein